MKSVNSPGWRWVSAQTRDQHRRMCDIDLSTSTRAFVQDPSHLSVKLQALQIVGSKTCIVRDSQESMDLSTIQWGSVQYRLGYQSCQLGRHWGRSTAWHAMMHYAGIQLKYDTQELVSPSWLSGHYVNRTKQRALSLQMNWSISSSTQSWGYWLWYTRW